LTAILNSTAVRKEWSRFIDDVVRTKPALVKRNRDLIAVLSLDLLDCILSEYVLTLEIEREEDGSYTGSFREIDIAGNARDTETLKEKLAREIIEYSQEYLEDFKTHYYSPNRRKHFPYIYRASLYSGNVDRVKDMITINPETPGEKG
jgi:uncharacterized protein YbcC (UPF0753/DUF2309 family)